MFSVFLILHGGYSDKLITVTLGITAIAISLTCMVIFRRRTWIPRMQGYLTSHILWASLRSPCIS